jgi:hypothetical protein
MASTGGPARRPAAPQRSRGAARTLGSRTPAAPATRTADDPVAAALAIWTSVTAGLEAAHYPEVGAEYAKLSALLAQQRTAQLLAGGRPGPEWTELARTAQRALDLLEPLLGAARLLATLPVAPAPATRPPRQVPPAARTARKAAPHT